ncbi:MAG: type II secretion system protein [Betaproteobacteria bacterium]|nr:type II secretion system protein [Betaproteobacteria bacterium]
MTRLFPHAIFLPRLQRGFTLAELAIVLVIISFLLGGTMAMISAQTEQRYWNDTQSRLEAARDAILGYAIANGRLPCPANSTSSGAEVHVSGVCGAAGNTYDYYGGVVAGVTYGLMPAVTLGYQPVDSQGFALDAWGNRIRYTVSRVTTPVTTSANFTNAANMKASGVTVLPNDLVVCASATGILPGNVPPTCNTAPSVTGQQTVVAILYSPGKNGREPVTLGADEAANEDRAATNDAVFVSHTPAPTGATGGEFDDQVLWISVGTLYSKLIAAGVLP